MMPANGFAQLEYISVSGWGMGMTNCKNSLFLDEIKSNVDKIKSEKRKSVCLYAIARASYIHNKKYRYVLICRKCKKSLWQRK